MVKVVAENKVNTESIEAFVELAKELISETRKEVGCIAYDLYQDVEDNTIITFIEEWEDMDKLNAHFESAHFKRLVPQIGELCEGDVRVYNKIV